MHLSGFAFSHFLCLQRHIYIINMMLLIKIQVPFTIIYLPWKCCLFIQVQYVTHLMGFHKMYITHKVVVTMQWMIIITSKVHLLAIRNIFFILCSTNIIISCNSFDHHFAGNPWASQQGVETCHMFLQLKMLYLLTFWMNIRLFIFHNEMHMCHWYCRSYRKSGYWVHVFKKQIATI